MDSHPFYDLIGQYGLYAVFVLAMIEGDITLLLAGVLAHSGFFGEYSSQKSCWLEQWAARLAMFWLTRRDAVSARQFATFAITEWQSRVLNG